MSKILLSPFVWVLNLFYGMTDSYGMALILFALVVKVILFPLQLKGKRSMIQMNMLSGQLQKIQKQYGKDKERYNQEVQKLYEREKINPMGGCLWSMIPLFILLPLYAIIRQPLTYMMDLTPDQIRIVANQLDWNSVATAMNWSTPELLEKALASSQEMVAAGKAAVASSFQDNGFSQLYLASLITPESVAGIQDALQGVGNVFAMNFDFLGIFNLALIPKLKFWSIEGGFALFLLPVISAVTGLLFSLISQKTNDINNQAQQANGSMKVMLVLMPLMSLWIGFTMPAALCLYWIIQNVLSMAQEYICSKMLKKDYEKAAAAREEREREEKEEEQERKRKAAEERAQRMEEIKNAKGKKRKELINAEKDANKTDTANISVSGIGLRSYARGRSYDPNRYSPDGPTAYHDPDLDWAEAKRKREEEEKAAAAKEAERQAKKHKKSTNEDAPVENHGNNDGKER